LVTCPILFPGGGREGSRGGKEQEVKEERGVQAPEVDCPLSMLVHAADLVFWACRRLRGRRERRTMRERRAWRTRVVTAATTMRKRPGAGVGAGVEEGEMTRRKSLCFQG
jgi:hypothetical protein